MPDFVKICSVVLEFLNVDKRTNKWDSAERHTMDYTALINNFVCIVVIVLTEYDNNEADELCILWKDRW